MKKTSANGAAASVAAILKNVSRNGDAALTFYAAKFDGVRLSPRQFLVPKPAMKAAYGRLAPGVRAALLLARERIEFFHRRELANTVRDWSAEKDGLKVGQRASAVRSVGIYVPGGRFPYPSTVLMTAIPARVAGVSRVVMVTPPKNLTDEILAAAHLAGVDACYRVGGPAAIGALAYGTGTVPKVDKIVGPGNRYVTEAKRQVYGIVGIDGLAGPSEIAVAADASADQAKVVLNLLAQAEHDPDAGAVLLSRDPAVIASVKKSVPAAFRKQVRCVRVRSDDALADAVNAIAPEHLYLAVKNPRALLSKIRNAGAIFVGEDSPVPLGDYVAGPSHVLPTNRSARFGSGLSVKDFLKWSSVIETRRKNAAVFRAAQVLADVEGLRHHSLALAVCLDGREKGRT